MTDGTLPKLLELNLTRCRDRFAELLKVGDFRSFRIQLAEEHIPEKFGTVQSLIELFQGRLLAVDRSGFFRPSEGDRGLPLAARMEKADYFRVRTLYIAERPNLAIWPETQQAIAATKTLLGWRNGRVAHADDWLLFVHGLGWFPPVGLPYFAERFLATEIAVDDETIAFPFREHFGGDGANSQGLIAQMVPDLFIDRQPDPTIFVSEIASTMFASMSAIDALLCGSRAATAWTAPAPFDPTGAWMDFVEERGFHVAEFAALQGLIDREFAGDRSDDWIGRATGDGITTDREPRDEVEAIVQLWRHYRKQIAKPRYEEFEKTLTATQLALVNAVNSGRGGVRVFVERIAKREAANKKVAKKAPTRSFKKSGRRVSR